MLFWRYTRNNVQKRGACHDENIKIPDDYQEYKIVRNEVNVEFGQ